MDTHNVYLDAYNSVVRHLQNLLQVAQEQGLSDNIEFRDIDGHAEDAVLENIDYLFIKEFSGNIENHLRYWTFLVGISTFEDLNMFRHRSLLNFFIDRFLPLTTIQLYDSDTGKPSKGNLIVQDDLTVVPFSKYNTRAVQYLSVGVASTETTHAHLPPDHI
jgi:hypothetical protein